MSHRSIRHSALVVSTLVLSCSWQSARSEESPAASAASPAFAASAASAVKVLNGAKPGSLELRAKVPTKLSPQLNVERLMPGGSFEPVQNLDLGSMRLVTKCSQRLNSYVIVGEQGLCPVPWTGMSCSSQCNHTCRANIKLTGRFRFVVTSFEGGARYEGPVFELK